MPDTARKWGKFGLMAANKPENAERSVFVVEKKASWMNKGSVLRIRLTL